MLSLENMGFDPGHFVPHELQVFERHRFRERKANRRPEYSGMEGIIDEVRQLNQTNVELTKALIESNKELVESHRAWRSVALAHIQGLPATESEEASAAIEGFNQAAAGFLQAVKELREEFRK